MSCLLFNLTEFPHFEHMHGTKSLVAAADYFLGFISTRANAISPVHSNLSSLMH